MLQKRAFITLEQARQIVRHLEADEFEPANEIVHAITVEASEDLFTQVGKLTRQVHDSLSCFQLDDRINNLTETAMPDARSRLEYVIKETEKAANFTMDAVEKIKPSADRLKSQLTTILPEWKKLMSRQIELGEFESLCYALDNLLMEASEESEALNIALNKVLLAQGYQDLTGQVIRRVIEIVNEVEEHLVEMLATFGEVELHKTKIVSTNKKNDKVKAEGPIIDTASRDDVVDNQDDVDDLLSSLGF